MKRLAVMVALLIAATGCTSGDATDTTTTSTSSATTTTAGTAPTTTSTTQPATTSTTTTTLPEPPHLEVLDPAHGATVTSANYTFTGVTDPGCTVTVGGRYEATVDEDGTWSLDLMLEPGRNSTTFTATHPGNGLETSEAIRVYCDEPPGLTGKVIRMVWEELGLVQAYYLGSEPTGYYTGSRLLLARSSDGSEILIQLGLSSRDPTIPKGRLNADFDGLVTILEDAGNESPWVERHLVLDEQPVMVAANAGVLTAMCPVDDIPHVVTLGFSDQGLRLGQAWRIDVDPYQLVEIPVDELPCPDLTAHPYDPDGIGAITIHPAECSFDPACGSRFYDIASGHPVATPFWTIAGSLIPPDDDYHSAYAVSVVTDTGDPEQVTAWRIWLEEMVARDWTGSPIWRVVDSTPASDHQTTIQCHTPDRASPVVALLDNSEDRNPLQAWTVNDERTRFIEIDPSPVVCPAEEGD